MKKLLVFIFISIILLSNCSLTFSKKNYFSIKIYGFPAWKNKNIEEKELKNLEDKTRTLKKFGILPNDFYMEGPASIFCISYGLNLPAIPLVLILLLYGYIFHLFPLFIFFLQSIFTLINIFTPPLPSLSTGMAILTFLGKNFVKISCNSIPI